MYQDLDGMPSSDCCNSCFCDFGERLAWPQWWSFSRLLRYRPRFFDPVRHQTTSTYIENKHFFTTSCHHQTYQNYEQRKQKFSIYAEVVWCPTWSKNHRQYLFQMLFYKEYIFCIKISKNKYFLVWLSFRPPRLPASDMPACWSRSAELHHWGHAMKGIVHRKIATIAKVKVNLIWESVSNQNFKTFSLGAIFILRKGVLRLFEPPTHLRKEIFTT